VFIHDLAEDRDKAWERENSNEPPWPQLLSHKVPSARILAYGYNTSWVKDLGSIVDPKYLDQETEKLLKCLADQNEDGDAGADVRPIIIFAHGFGGLIYEQVRRAMLYTRHRLT
jgi:hypothetical protein